MPFIGQQPVTGAYHKLDSITTSATATYNLQLNGSAYSPASANHLLVSLNGVMQAPQDSFTVSGSQITFASALTSSDSIDFIMALGDVLNIGTPSDGSVNTSQLANSAVTDAKMASTLDLSGKTVTYGLTRSDMPSGSVLQVVNQRISTETTNTSNSVWADVGFSLSITPTSTSNKILVTAHINASNRTNGLGENFRLKRNGTVIETQLQFNQVDTITSSSPSGNGHGVVQTYYFYDSPASTSAQTYTIEFIHRTGNTGSFTVNYSTASGYTPVYSNLQLMEIAG